MGLVAHFSKSFGSQQRGAAKRTLRLEAEGHYNDGLIAPLVIHDLSATGLLVETNDEHSIGEKLQIEMPDARRYAAKVVWSSEGFVGCKFDRPLPRAALCAALLRSVQPGAEQRLEVTDANGAVQKLQARVKDLVQGPTNTDAVIATMKQQSGSCDDRPASSCARLDPHGTRRILRRNLVADIVERRNHLDPWRASPPKPGRCPDERSEASGVS